MYQHLANYISDYLNPEAGHYVEPTARTITEALEAYESVHDKTVTVTNCETDETDETVGATFFCDSCETNYPEVAVDYVTATNGDEIVTHKRTEETAWVCRNCQAVYSQGETRHVHGSSVTYDGWAMHGHLQTINGNDPNSLWGVGGQVYEYDLLNHQVVRQS